MRIEEQFAKYLKQPGFKRFISAWVKKYQSLGHFGGKISLDDLSNEEQICLSGLLGLDLSNRQLRLSYYRFTQSLKNTKFEQADFLVTLELLVGNKIISNRENQRIEKNKFEQYKTALLVQFSDTEAYSWLEEYLNNDSMVKRYYELNQNRFYKIIINVVNALNNLPAYQSNYDYLAIFATKITKDPHYFDEDLPLDLLLKGIAHINNVETIGKTSEETASLLYLGGILKDDLSNYCYICHLLPSHKSSWASFYDNYEPWNANLYNLNKVDNFIKMPIFIIENPSVFRVLCSFIKHHHLEIGLVCSNGQINLCTYQLFDKLVKSGCQLYYSGDFDPEGLLIAQKLKQKYQSKLTLCGYQQSLFEQIKVDQIEISSKRVQMLKGIIINELALIANEIISSNSFGYQEGLIDYYQDYILENICIVDKNM